jgi:hypothetical protein
MIQNGEKDSAIMAEHTISLTELKKYRRELHRRLRAKQKVAQRKAEAESL